MILKRNPVIATDTDTVVCLRRLSTHSKLYRKLEVTVQWNGILTTFGRKSTRSSLKIKKKFKRAPSRTLVGGRCQHAAGVDGVLGGIGLGGGRLVGGRALRLLRQVRRGVVALHALIILIGTLSRLLFLLLLVIVRVSVWSPRIVRVDLRRRLQDRARLEMRRLEAVERGWAELADEVVEGEVGGQVLGARRWRRRRGQRVCRRRGRQRQRLPVKQTDAAPRVTRCPTAALRKPNMIMTISYGWFKFASCSHERLQEAIKCRQIVSWDVM